MNHPPRLLALVVPPVERVEGFGVQPGPAERSVTSMSGCRVGLPLDTVTGEQVWSRNEISTSGPLSRPPPTFELVDRSCNGSVSSLRWCARRPVTRKRCPSTRTS